MHFFTSIFKLYSKLLATKTDFLPFRKKIQKHSYKKIKAIYPSFILGMSQTKNHDDNKLLCSFHKEA